MKKDSEQGLSKRYITYITIIFSILIIGSSLTFHYISSYNYKILEKTVEHYSDEAVTNRIESTLVYLNTPPLLNKSEFRMRILERCSIDRGFLGVLLFSRTQDENFFRVSDIIKLHSEIEIPFSLKNEVKPSGRENLLKQGLLNGVIDSKVYKQGAIHWQDAYFPLKIKKRNYVILFMMASDSFPEVIKYYQKTIRMIKNGMIVFSIILALAVIIFSLLFIQQYSVLLDGLSSSIKKAAEGDLSVNINAPSESEFAELAMSFNGLIEELKEKETREKSLQEKIRLTENEIMEQKEQIEKNKTETNKIEVNADDPLSELFNTGVKMMKDNLLDDAASIFRTLTIMKPEGFASHFNLGVAFARKKMYHQSLEMLYRAAELNPGYEMTDSYIEKVKRLIKKYEPN